MLLQVYHYAFVDAAHNTWACVQMMEISYEWEYKLYANDCGEEYFIEIWDSKD